MMSRTPLTMTDSSATLDSILGKLNKVRRAGDGWTACCPAHEDSNPSLSISHKEDRILLYCQAGCDIESVVESLDLEMSDLFDEPSNNGKPTILAEYDYVDEEGEVLYQVVRYMPKDFR